MGPLSAGGWWAKIKMNQEKCEGCFYFKVRDVDSETGDLAWGPWCLESGQPVKCEIAVVECDQGQTENSQDKDAQLVLKYVTSNKRKR